MPARIEDAADVVLRLREMAGPRKPNLCDEAADLIERLVVQLEDCENTQESE